MFGYSSVAGPNRRDRIAHILQNVPKLLLANQDNGKKSSYVSKNGPTIRSHFHRSRRVSVSRSISLEVLDDSKGAACYPTYVLKSRPWAKFFVLLALVALIAQLTRRTPDVSISGLKVGIERAEVLQRLGQPDFQSGYPEVSHIEYWKHTPPLELDFDEQGRLSRIQGGIPMLDGENVQTLSLESAERRLGRALHREQQPNDGPVLRYEQFGLLVSQTSKEELSFLLFKPRRSGHAKS